MSSLETIRHKWESAHDQPRFRPRYPHEEVVRWTFRSFDRTASSPPRLLDLGAGAGRHSLFFAREGFEAHANDLSLTGLNHLENEARDQGLLVRTQQGPATDLSAYPTAFFDGVCCFGVLYYMSLPEIERCIREVYRVLKPGGRFFAVTRSEADSRIKHAHNLGQCRWRLDILDPAAPSTMEQGLEMVFLPESEVTRLFGAFPSFSLGRMSITHDGFLDDDWLIYFNKA